MSGSERRTQKRRHLFYYLKVFDDLSGRLIGHLVDITPDGVMLIGRDPVRVGAEYRLRLILPEGFSTRQDLVVAARSQWCRRDTNPDYWGIGLRLTEVSQADRSLVETMIYKFGFAH